MTDPLDQPAAASEAVNTPGDAQAAPAGTQHVRTVRSIGGFHAELPVIATPLDPDGVLHALQARSKRGKLAGFKDLGSGAEGAKRAFACDVFGHPFDRTLRGDVFQTADGSRIELDSKLKPVTPWLLFVGTLLAVWPGVLLVHSMLTAYFGWYPKAQWITWAWYVPLTLLTFPVLWQQLRKSEQAASEEAITVVAALRETVGG